MDASIEPAVAFSPALPDGARYSPVPMDDPYAASFNGQ